MATVVCNNSSLVVCGTKTIKLFDFKSQQSRDICIPPINVPPNLTKNQQDVLKNESPSIVSCCFSKCGDYFAICAKNKQLVVYDSDFEVYKNLIVQRSVSKIRFVPSGDIIVADKTGDVYLYKLKEDSTIHLLGHLSMVLDVLVSDCERYILTCDRDEKIRTSYYPGGYNIVNYCLGHEEFVLNMEFLDDDTLISSSGDGSIRLWDFLQGKQVNAADTNVHIDDKSLVQKFSETMDCETVEVNALPVTSMKIHNFQNFTIVVVSLHTYNALQVYTISKDKQIKFLQTLKFDCKILSFDVKEKLYVLTSTDILVFEFKDVYHKVYMADVDEFFKTCKDMVGQCEPESISVLYKRKFDNMQEYQQRKKLRIENRNVK